MENRTKLERQGGGERLLEGAITAAGGGDRSSTDLERMLGMVSCTIQNTGHT